MTDLPTPESTARFRAVFERAGAAMLLADDNRNYIDVNPAAERLVRRSREVLLTLRIDDLTPPESLRDLPAGWEAFLSGEPIEWDYDLLLPDGSLQPVSGSASASIMPGVHLAVMTAARDGAGTSAGLADLRATLMSAASHRNSRDLTRGAQRCLHASRRS